MECCRKEVEMRMRPNEMNEMNEWMKGEGRGSEEGERKRER